MVIPTVLGSTHLAFGGYEVPVFLYVSVVFITSFILLPMFLFRKWYSYRRRLKANLITSEYEPPSGLTPAEIQYLFGGINNERITTATIIHMVQRGYLHMRKENGKKKVFPGPKAADVSLKIWEQMILTQIEASPEGASADTVMKHPIAFVDKNIQDKHSDASTLSDYIAESLKKRKLIKGKGVNTFFLEAFIVAVFLIASLVLWPIFFYWFLSLIEASTSDLASIQDFAMAAVIISAAAFVPLYAFSVFFVKWRAQLFGRRWMASDRLNRQWPQMMGFRHFVKLTEKNRLQFDSEELQKSSSKDILPYAVALGFVENWHSIVV